MLPDAARARANGAVRRCRLIHLPYFGHFYFSFLHRHWLSLPPCRGRCCHGYAAAATATLVSQPLYARFRCCFDAVAEGCLAAPMRLMRCFLSDISMPPMIFLSFRRHAPPSFSDMQASAMYAAALQMVSSFDIADIFSTFFFAAVLADAEAGSRYDCFP